MSTTAAPLAEQPAAAPSPAGPLADGDAALPLPPRVELPKLLQTLRIGIRQIEFVSRAHRELGDVFRMRCVAAATWPWSRRIPTTSSRSSRPGPSRRRRITGESPLRPIVGPNSVLTAIGPRHMRQRKLLLPPFHGEAVERYTQMIAEAADREIDRWPIGTPFALAPRMQAITLDVIMAGIFGIEGQARAGHARARVPAGHPRAGEPVHPARGSALRAGEHGQATSPWA